MFIYLYIFFVSVVAICHKEFGIGEEVELQLMRRERDSLLPVPATAFSQEIIAKSPRLSHPTAATPYAKLLVASKDEASDGLIFFLTLLIVTQLLVTFDGTHDLHIWIKC